MPHVQLRLVRDTDLDTLYEQGRDPAANEMAAFTAKDPGDRAAFDAHWARIRGNEAIVLRTIEADGEIAGYVASFLRGEEREVSYWLGSRFWNRGIATAALRQLLGEVASRPLFARVAKENGASLRVLDKCGFAITGEGRYFSNSRGREVEEFILTLAR